MATPFCFCRIELRSVARRLNVHRHAAAVAASNSAVGCLDNDGQPVDWWVMLKVRRRVCGPVVASECAVFVLTRARSADGRATTARTRGTPTPGAPPRGRRAG